MAVFLLRRLALLLVTTWLVFTAVFFLVHLIPGDPVLAMLGERAANADLAELRAALGLDQPISVQYGRALSGLCHGDLGTSVISRMPVVNDLKRAMIPTLLLAISSMSVAVLLGFLSGIFSAVKAGSVWDRILMVLAVAGVAIPNMWLGPMLMKYLSVEWNLLPISGMDEPGAMILPAITLGTAMAGLFSRITRSALLKELSQDYIRTARAKGLPAAKVIWRHGVRNALIPVVTIGGLQFGVLLTGAVITEKIFRWPGLGSLLLGGIDSRDYPMVQGCVLIIAVVYALANLAVDLSYLMLDPRVRLWGKAS